MTRLRQGGGSDDPDRNGKLGRPRPAVIVQTEALGDETTAILVCPLTSDVTEKLSVRPVVEVFPTNGLRIRSQIMTDKVLALHRARVRQVVGTLDLQTVDQLDRALPVVR